MFNKFLSSIPELAANEINKIIKIWILKLSTTAYSSDLALNDFHLRTSASFRKN